MKIKIDTLVPIPEIPKEVEIEDATLESLSLRLFRETHFADQLIDKEDGRIKTDGLFDMAVNGVPLYELPEGLNTRLKDGDTITISMIMLGGG